MTGQGTETGRNALAGLPAVQSRRLHRNRLYRRGERTFSSLGRRKSSTLQDSSTWNYTYNQRSEITSAIRKNASNVTQNTMRYGFDNIGNRTSSYENPTSKTYSANSLNQYTGIDVVGSSSISPQYDDDGNMTGYGSWTYTWDAENRLVKAVNGTTRLEFIYDALSRRVAKKLYQGNTLSKHERYVYDGMKLLASYNAKSSYAKINTFLWQPFGADVPLIMTYGSTNYGYLVDANKNVLGLFNPSQSRVATYLYGPFGQIISSSGTIAANNPIRFSSEQFDADLGLVYYNYRYYFPAIGKWLTKDPIGEMGGWNLYAFCGNNAVNTWDRWGQIYENKSLNETNDPYLRFLSGLKYDEVYRAQHERERNNCQQNDSLDCGQDKNGVPILQVKDDAGKYCCPDQMSIIELRIEKTTYSNIGHAFLVQIKNNSIVNAWGFYSKDEKIFHHPGRFFGIDESEHTHHYDFCVSYKACENSVRRIDENYNKSKTNTYYNLFNVMDNSYNCFGMALKWLEDSGFKTPNVSSLPVIPGNNLSVFFLLFSIFTPLDPLSFIFYLPYFPNAANYLFFSFNNADAIHNANQCPFKDLEYEGSKTNH